MKKYFFPLLVIAVLSGCLKEAGWYKAFYDGKNFVVTREEKYEIGDTGKIIKVPVGFVTDFATIPEGFSQSLISKLGPHNGPALVHDYLYWNQSCSKKEADFIFRLAMEEKGVDVSKQLWMFQAVDGFFGKNAWKDNEREKGDGLVKVIPENRLDFDPTLTWKQYRKILRDQGVKDSDPNKDLKAICSAIGPYINQYEKDDPNASDYIHESYYPLDDQTISLLSRH